MSFNFLIVAVLPFKQGCICCQ